MGIDAAGVIEYCIPGEAGITGSPIPPDAGWVSLKSLSIYQGYLYILDAGGHAVYRYVGTASSMMKNPSLFFDQIVPDLTDALILKLMDLNCIS